MHTFAQKRKTPLPTPADKSILASRAPLGHNHDMNSAPQSPARDTEDAKADSAATGTPRLAYDFGRIGVHAAAPASIRTPARGGDTGSGQARPSGSDSINAEEEQAGPIGEDATATSPSPAAPSTPTTATPTGPTAPAPTAPAPAGPAPAGPGPATPPALTITSATVKAAPSGAVNTRTRVGVGEVVDFTGSAAGTWTASMGTASGPNSTTFRWTAPATTTPTTATITLTVGTQSVPKTVTVVPPNNISMTNAGSHASLVGAGGACMLTAVTFGPTDVCLGAIQTLEVPGPATQISGFFTKFSAATLYHHPNANYALVDDNNMKEAGPNNGRYDHCAWHSTPGPYSDGAYRWVIPNRYILDGESPSSGRHFTDTTQQFTMNAAGTMTITKAGAST